MLTFSCARAEQILARRPGLFSRNAVISWTNSMGFPPFGKARDSSMTPAGRPGDQRPPRARPRMPPPEIARRGPGSASTGRGATATRERDSDASDRPITLIAARRVRGPGGRAGSLAGLGLWSSGAVGVSPGQPGRHDRRTGTAHRGAERPASCPTGTRSPSEGNAWRTTIRSPSSVTSALVTDGKSSPLIASADGSLAASTCKTTQTRPSRFAVRRQAARADQADQVGQAHPLTGERGRLGRSSARRFRPSSSSRPRTRTAATAPHRRGRQAHSRGPGTAGTAGTGTAGTGTTPPGRYRRPGTGGSPC